MKASDLFVKCLEAEGVEYIFGVPGEENADFMMSLEKSDKIKFILTRHEQGAAFMAEIYGRLTGMAAGCLGTLGPGATNLITGVADSNMDRAPMLALTGQGASTRLHKESHQVMDVVEMFRPVTKWAHSIIHQDTIPETIRKAVRLACLEKPGAVHIELPEDIAKKDTDVPAMDRRRVRRAVPADKIVDLAFDAIKNAKRPVILAGNGCIRKRASKQLRQLLRANRHRRHQHVYGQGLRRHGCRLLPLYRRFGQQRIWSSRASSTMRISIITHSALTWLSTIPSLWNPDGMHNASLSTPTFSPAEIDH